VTYSTTYPNIGFAADLKSLGGVAATMREGHWCGGRERLPDLTMCLSMTGVKKSDITFHGRWGLRYWAAHCWFTYGFERLGRAWLARAASARSAPTSLA